MADEKSGDTRETMDGQPAAARSLPSGRLGMLALNGVLGLAFLVLMFMSWLAPGTSEPVPGVTATPTATSGAVPVFTLPAATPTATTPRSTPTPTKRQSSGGGKAPTPTATPTTPAPPEPTSTPVPVYPTPTPTVPFLGG